MKRYPICLLALLLATTISRAQDTSAAVVPAVWRVDFLGLGVMNEVRLGQKTTLNSGFYFGTQFMGAGGGRFAEPNRAYWSYQFFPVVHSGARYFYNLERRLQKGKSIRYNSGNYISGRVSYRFSPILERYDAGPIANPAGMGFEGLWGFQRTYRRHFYLNLSLGVGVYPTRTAALPFGGAGDFTIGYTFPNKRGR